MAHPEGFVKYIIAVLLLPVPGCPGEHRLQVAPLRQFDNHPGINEEGLVRVQQCIAGEAGLIEKKAD